MLTHTLFAVAALSVAVLAQPNPPANPDPTDTTNPNLEGKRFPFNDLPEQADTLDTARGTQTGYNRCNSTTEGPESLCQTLIVNTLEDFCIWGPPIANQTIGGTEEELVAWCTQPGHGTRIIPSGAITGAQFITTPSYVEVTGHIHQGLINIMEGDTGGEEDSHAQDKRGNPIGGLAYSNTIPGSNGQYQQSVTWHYFVGGDVFCLKLCALSAPNAQGLCNNVFDTLGCNTNVPAAYVDGVFLQCDGGDQAPVAPGVTAVPSSSNCVTSQSSAIYPTASTTSTTTTTTSGSQTTGGSGSSSSGSKSGTSTSGTTSPSASSAALRQNVGSAAVGLLVTVAGALIGVAVLV